MRPLVVVGERGEAGAGGVRPRLWRALPRALPTGKELAVGAELLGEHGLTAEVDRLVAGGQPVDDGSDDLGRLTVSWEPELRHVLGDPLRRDVARVDVDDQNAMPAELHRKDAGHPVDRRLGRPVADPPAALAGGLERVAESRGA